MPSLTRKALDLYRRFFALAGPTGDAGAGGVTVLDGHHAVAFAESMIAEDAVFCASYPGAPAAPAGWAKIREHEANAFGGALGAHLAAGPRGVVAATIGLALAGRRATACLSGPEIAAVQDLLIAAAGRRLPLVLHLSNRATAAHGGALGSGHEAVHLSADSGFFVLFAANVQEAVDFTLVARRVAETTLTPGMVVMDGEQTALAVQDVRLPSVRELQSFVGAAAERVATPTAAQRLLFGESRRRVPRWHDLDRPVLQGALFGSESFALGAAAGEAYFLAHVGATLRESLAQYAELTGRVHTPLSAHGVADAETVLIVEGAAIETACTVADYLRREQRTRIGVIGIHCLRPFPGAELGVALVGCKHVVVLERLRTPLAGDPPLLREVRAQLARPADRRAQGARATRPAGPRCHAVSYGLGGLPLRAADLVALVAALEVAGEAPTHLGVDFGTAVSRQPKRQALFDTLRRAYPATAGAGLRSPAPVDSGAQAALTVGIDRSSGDGHDTLVHEAAALLVALDGGHLRSRPGLSWEDAGSACQDWFMHARGALRDPGDAPLLDLAVFTTAAPDAQRVSAARVRAGGMVLFEAGGSEAPALRAALRELGQRQGVRCYLLGPRARTSPASATAADDADMPSAAALAAEYWLGGIFGALVEGGLVKHTPHRLAAARKEALRETAHDAGARLVETFVAGFESVLAVAVDAAAEAPEPAGEPEVPLAVRHLGRSDTRYDSLAGFWDRVGVLYRTGETAALTADPYLATGTIPPLSSAFCDQGDGREMLPDFDPSLCTGCGRCWTVCPDNAIAAVFSSPAGLVDAGIRQSAADALRPVSAQLAARMLTLIRRGETRAATAGELLVQAADWLGDILALSAGRKLAIAAGIDAVHARIGRLPIAITPPFTRAAEAAGKDGGALLSIAINPETCKACGLCVAACAPGALSRVARSPARVEAARGVWKIWAAVPDTRAEIIERLMEDPEVGSMAAVLLSRYCHMALAGGDGAEPGSGEKIALKLVVATTEFVQQPRVQRFARAIEAQATAITAAIREALAVSAPVADFDRMTKRLEDLGKPQVDLATLAAELQGTPMGRRVDAERLHRQIGLARELLDLHERLVRGEHGLGRARFGLALAPGAGLTWAGAFPSNPFQVPVVIDTTGGAAQIAAGLAAGQRAETLAAVVLARRAQLELDAPAGADWQRAALVRLGWDGLDADERRLCPPLILAGGDDVLGGRAFADVAWLLNSALPVKILVLADLDFGVASDARGEVPGAELRQPRADLALMALAQRRAYVAQSAISAPDHLHRSVSEALNFDGPALLHVHAPSPARHGFSTARTVEQARLAVASRTFPLFRYDPDREGVFGSRIDLEGNPQPAETWIWEDPAQPLTPALWALGEQRFATGFTAVAADDPAPTELSAWLALDAGARAARTPIVTRASTGAVERFRVDAGVATMVAERRDAWRMLQELAGIVTPFTTRLAADLRAEIALEHTRELAARDAETERRMRELENALRQEMAARVRTGLLALAGYRSDDSDATARPPQPGDGRPPS